MEGKILSSSLVALSEELCPYTEGERTDVRSPVGVLKKRVVHGKLFKRRGEERLLMPLGRHSRLCLTQEKLVDCLE